MDSVARELADILACREGRVGRLRLNRASALHSLTRHMLRAMATALLQWRSDPRVEIILIDHADGRGFCAGGDVVSVASDLNDAEADGRAFFLDEYRLNHLLYIYPKTGVAFMDGITMGGGVGIARPCRYRVATERTVFAMPETAIGIFPDVGAGHFLPQLHGRLAQFIALTSARLNGAECYRLQLATHYIFSERLEEAKRRIIEQPSNVGAILDEFHEREHPDAPVVRRTAEIDELFASDRLKDILVALDRAAGSGSEWAAAQATAIRRRSPTACSVALRLFLESTKQASFADEMRLEYGLMSRLISRADFREGVRALLIDKSGNPEWDPARPEDVTDEMLDVLFAPLPETEAWTPFPEAKE